MTDLMSATSQGYFPQEVDDLEDDKDLEPYMSLFLKPLSRKKCAFSKSELEVMCRDPLHSPRLIGYLIAFVRAM